MEETTEDPTMLKLESACSNLRTLVQTSTNLETSLLKMDTRLDLLQDTLTNTWRTIAPLQSLAMANKALDTRINRAVSPALTLLESFKLAESLQQKLLNISSKLLQLPSNKKTKHRLVYLVNYVDCVHQLNLAIDSISRDCEPAIQKLQEVVEFLCRTKATDPYRTRRLQETLVTLKALYETEVDAMRYEGLLDEALLNLQDEYEALLQQLKHKNIGVVEDPIQVDGKLLLLGVDDIKPEIPGWCLGSEMEIHVLKRIAETLSNNDCLDICIDIFVKVRYTRAAKALMRLNPDYLRTYTPEEIDEMEWESLETSIALWIQHFELAVRTVFVSEKELSRQVLSQVMDGIIWAECFVKISDKIMAVFFRFGEGVTRSSKEPQKLFKLLDMFDSLEKLKPDFSDIFQGEAGADICLRFRELEKLLVHASSKVFWEFGLQIEANQDGIPPPQDGSVPKLVRYAINYLKYLATNTYRGSMAKVLRTEQIWKAGLLSKPPAENDESLLKDAIMNVMEALERNIDSKKQRYKDKVLLQIFCMNTYWYIYMRTRNTEMSKVIGDQSLKMRYKTVAEEAAYMYQRQAWIPIVRLLMMDRDEEEEGELRTDAAAVVYRKGDLILGKIEAFIKGFNENIERHRNSYNIPDADLREQIRDATVKLVVPAYVTFLTANSKTLQVKSFLPLHSVEQLLERTFGFDGTGTTNQNKNQNQNVNTTTTTTTSTITTSRRRQFKNQSVGKNSASAERGIRRLNSDGGML